MLSYIYRIVAECKSEYGYFPNVLYLTPRHHTDLVVAFEDRFDTDTISRLLGLSIRIYQDVVHPRVAYLNSNQRSRVAVG